MNEHQARDVLDGGVPRSELTAAADAAGGQLDFVAHLHNAPKDLLGEASSPSGQLSLRDVPFD